MEKGVVVGKFDERMVFIASINDVLVHFSNNNNLEIGDCVQFFVQSFNTNQKQSCHRKAINVVRCPQFLEVRRNRNNRNCSLLLKVLEVNERFNPSEGRMTKVLRTDFLEEVWDRSYASVTSRIDHRELIGMKVLCKRMYCINAEAEIWVADKIFSDPEHEMVPTSIESVSFENSTKMGCTLHTGFIMRSGMPKKGSPEVFVCIPQLKTKVFVTGFVRRKLARTDCIGRWISFKLNENNELDDYSDVRIIDDCLPTRKFFTQHDIRVHCSFDCDKWDKRRSPILYSDYCGQIVDISSVLSRYKKLYNFTSYAWIRNDYYQDDNEIQFVLSELQEEWESDVDNDGSRSEAKSAKFNSSSNNKGFYENERLLDDSEDRNTFERPSERNSNIKWSMNRQTSGDFSSDRRSESSSKSDYSPDMTNQIDPKMRTENIFKKISFSHKPTDDFEDSDSEVEDSVYSTKQEPKSEFEKLKFKYEYCTKEGLPVSSEVLQRLKEELEEEMKINKQKKIEDDDTRSSGISTSRESAATKVLQDEINKYKRVVKLAREFFEHNEVYDIMKSIDRKKTNELFDEIRNL